LKRKQDEIIFEIRKEPERNAESLKRLEKEEAA